MNTRFLKFVFFFTHLSSNSATAGENSCFDFPTLPSALEVNAKEGTTLTLQFQLKGDGACSIEEQQRTTIYISKPADTIEEVGTEFCIIRLTHDKTCNVPFKKNNCRCPDGYDPRFEFTKTVTRADNGIWTWRLGTKVPQLMKVVFNIQYENGVTIASNQGNNSPPKKTSMRKNSGAQGSNNVAKHADALDDHDKDGRSEETTVSSSDVVSETETGSAEENALPSGLAIFAAVFVAANVITIVAVSVIVYVLRGRRERKRRNPDSALPPTPGTRTTAGRKQSRRTEPAVMDASMHSYVELPIRPESRRYEQIPAASIAVGNDGYEIPMFNDPK